MILRWNCQGLRAKYEELQMLINQFSPICVSLQETMIGYSETPHPKDYVSYSTEFEPARGSLGGCGVFIRYDVAHTHVSLQTPLQAVAVQIHLKKKYNVMSLYLPPSAQVVERDLLDLFQQLSSPFLILGDFIGRHSAWGDITGNS